MPLAEPVLLAKRLAHQRVNYAARRLGLNRRQFLKTLSGAAATLAAMNEAFAFFNKTGGRYEIPKEAPLEIPAAASTLASKEFIFDIQGHHVNPQGGWRRFTNRWTYILRFFPQARCGEDAIECFSAEHFIQEVFLDSDTEMAVLSAVPAAPEDNPLSTAEAAATRVMVDAMEGDHRLLIHGLVHPNLPGSLEAMAEQKERFQVAAWKTYTQWGPEGRGFWLDDPEIGLPFIERARELAVPTICIHKGIPLFTLPYEFSTCRDIGVVARAYPDVNFIVYHAGYEPKRQEGPYDPKKASGGVDSLVKSLQDNGIAANSNVYAELGSTWRMLMQDPDKAAHVLGKLFKYVGENNVLWGTDSIWYGSPQDQIQAFRAFQIAETLQERYGYPEITPSLRAKVFGLNALKPYRLSLADIKRQVSTDHVQRIKQSYLDDPDPSFATYGPRTRGEFLRMRELLGKRP